MDTVIVGLTGFAQSGKDTAARGLIEARGFTRLAFADLLKKTAYNIDPYVETTPGHFERLGELVDRIGMERAKSYDDVRRLLQRLGTEGGRNNLGGDVWVDPVMRAATSAPSPVAITDVRFPNEVAAVKAAGGLVVRVVRPGVGAINAHSSDAGIANLPVDLEIENDSTVEALHAKMIDVADSLMAVTSRAS
ncbi:hypothetical protein [Ornithinimicrobium murale]|uniref:deoxynucleotide monophosphate kinase family protein n=1 Tax=Ornithinimicrobium murale TaxID=1050153 RepID=UPI000E0D008D|nr:hypothetical protein [Ornithinimicrobium murale]